MKAIINVGSIGLSFQNMDELESRFGGRRLGDGTGSVEYPAPEGLLPGLAAIDAMPVVVHDLTNLGELRAYVADQGWTMVME